MKAVRWIALALVVALAALVVAGCMGDDSGDEKASGTPQAQTPSGSDGMEMDEGEPSGGSAVSVASPATDLRVTLDRLLGEHAILAMVATQKGYDGDKDFKAIAAALDRNSVELADAIGSVYGDEAREEFLNGEFKWRAHIGFFVDYTVALAKKDKAGQQKAVNNLKGYIGSFSGFLAKATGLPADAVEKSITTHVNQLKGQIDAYAAGNYAEAYRIARHAYAHMFMTGDTLASAIVKQSPEKFAQGTVTQSSGDLRVTLDRLFGEHALLAMFATQKGLAGAEDFKAIGTALDRNSVDLAGAIKSVYGEQAAEEFLNGNSKWRAHIKFFVDYTVALAKKDKAGQQKAVNDLKGYIGSFSGFLAEATALPPADVEKSITEHVNQLKGQIDAYSQGRYGNAYGVLREAYAHMFMTGDAVAGAIVKQSPDKFAS